MCIDIFDGMVFLNQRQCALFSDSRHTGDIIGAVPHQRLDLNKRSRLHTVLFADRGGVHLLIDSALRGGLCQDDTDLIGDQLERIPIAGAKKHRIAVFLPLPCQTAQNIVCLIALRLQNGVAQKPQQLLHQRHLLTKFLRHALAGALVLLVHLMPEGGRMQIERKCHSVRLLLLNELINDIEKAVNRIGIDALPCGKQPHPVKGAVYDAVGVKGKNFHWVTSLGKAENTKKRFFRSYLLYHYYTMFRRKGNGRFVRYPYAYPLFFCLSL